MHFYVLKKQEITHLYLPAQPHPEKNTEKKKQTKAKANDK
ncbi:MAG: hypothetical protein Phog2KO_50170 [Phototrophicaceae bacterium]